MQESDHLAGAAGRAIVAADDIEAAIRAQIRRADRLHVHIIEAIIDGTLRVKTAGERVGQINGLSVSMLGSHAFGRPARITAQVRIGRGEFIDIEREVELGGGRCTPRAF